MLEDGIVDPVAYGQVDVFQSAMQFERAEGIIPAPETAHAVHAAMEIAKKCAQSGKTKTILIGFSRHGHFDTAAYTAYLDGKLERLSS